VNPRVKERIITPLPQGLGRGWKGVKEARREEDDGGNVKEKVPPSGTM
jgi:hypothetical protein